MSLYAANDFGYLQQAEAYFLSHSKLGVMLSSKDTEVLRYWRDAGVPIEVVCYGIRRGFHEFDEPPRSLFQCRHLVDAELQAWKDRISGGHADASKKGAAVKQEGRSFALPGRDLPDPTALSRRHTRVRLSSRRSLKASVERAQNDDETRQIPPGEEDLASWHLSMWRLKDVGRDSSHPQVREAYRWAWRRMQELRQTLVQSSVRGAALGGKAALSVGQIEAEMYDRVYDTIEPTMRDEIDKQLPTDMEEALGSMSKEASQRQFRIWRRRLLEETFSLKPFFVP